MSAPFEIPFDGAVIRGEADGFGIPVVFLHSGVTDRRMWGEQMQMLAAEFNLSESTFVFPPENPANTARVRIFHRTAEMPFAGHPTIGTAYVVGAGENSDLLRLEQKAGLVEVRLERDADGIIQRASLDAPQPLSTGSDVDAELVAQAIGIAPAAIVACATAAPRWLR